MNEKAAKLRTSHTRGLEQMSVIDSERNSKLIQEMFAVSRASKLETYLVMHEASGLPAATIIVRKTPSRCTIYVKRFMNGRVLMFKGSATGCGYDKETAAFDGCEIMHPDSMEKLKLVDGGARWHNQLLNGGFKVWQTL